MIKCSKSAAVSLPVPTQNLHGWLRLGEFFSQVEFNLKGFFVTS